jgi:hypothetical protein
MNNVPDPAQHQRGERIAFILEYHGWRATTKFVMAKT